MKTRLEASIRAAIAEAQRQAEVEGRDVVIVTIFPAAAEPKSFDGTWKADFLEHLRAGRTVRHAAELAGVSARHAYRCRREDPQLAAAWSAAKDRDGTSQRSHRGRGSVGS